MIWKYKIRKNDNISNGKKYCIALDHRQHSYAQAEEKPQTEKHFFDK